MRILIGAVGLALLVGCGKSVEDKMVSVCTEIVQMSVTDPGAMTINSSSVTSAEATELNLERFSGLASNGKLSVDQKAALDIQIKNLSNVKESYVGIDFTDRVNVTRRDKAICWFMDRGRGFELGTVSVAGKGYSGISLVSLFVERGRPSGLSRSNVIE